METRVLIADDDPQIRDVLRLALEREGFVVDTASDGAIALERIAKQAPDLLVLDIGMPKMDGFETIKALRADTALPVLFLSARDDEIDKVLGLELGGDDYVTKPFSPRELIARIRAILKRGSGQMDDSKLTHGALSLDTASMACDFNGQNIKLTRSEFQILERLMKRAGAVLDKPAIFDLLYNGNPNASDRTVDSHIRNLRAKLDDVGAKDAIETLHGIGIKLGQCNV